MAKYFFIHIPKTAGTSFRNMLINKFGQDDVFPDYKLLSKHNGYPSLDDIRSKYSEEIANASVFMGHYPITACKLFDKDIKLLTFFRDPVHRVVSFLTYYQKTVENYKGMPLELILEKEIGQASNFQLKMISGIFDDNKNIINAAIENLDKLDFFGLTEDFDNSISIAEKIFGWELGIKADVNKTGSTATISESLIKRIIEINREELEFYEVVKERYNDEKIRILSKKRNLINKMLFKSN